MDISTAQLSGEIGTFLSAIIAWATIAIPRFIGALVLLVVGWWVAARASRAMRRLLDQQSRIDATLCTVIASLVRYSILVIVLVAVLGQGGIQTTSILAALGAIGLAIGLALQGTLSNIAAGMMLLWLRPFRVGDYIDTGAVAGTVKDVGLFASELHSWDGIFQFVPNAELWNKRIVNYSRLPTRLVDLAYGVSYDDDLAKGQETLLALAKEDGRVAVRPGAGDLRRPARRQRGGAAPARLGGDLRLLAAAADAHRARQGGAGGGRAVHSVPAARPAHQERRHARQAGGMS